MPHKDDTSIKIGLGVWVCFCVLVSLWIFTRFLKGKQQLFSNLHVVEDSLRKLQEKLDLEQRKKSMGYVETLDEVTACLSEDTQKKAQTQQNDDGEDEGSQLLSTENEVSKLSKDPTDLAAEETLEDKKNI